MGSRLGVLRIGQWMQDCLCCWAQLGRYRLWFDLIDFILKATLEKLVTVRLSVKFNKPTATSS